MLFMITFYRAFHKPSQDLDITYVAYVGWMCRCFLTALKLKK